jgi:calcium-dependent protein kinase
MGKLRITTISSRKSEMAHHRASGMKRAIKIIKKDQSLSSNAILHEIRVLKKLDHPNIIRVFEVIIDSKAFNIVMELCTGGQLFDKIITEKNFSETVAANYMFDLVSAIKYCHDMRLVHRDLKPENLLLEDDSDHSRLKIIDFGTSQYFKPQEKLQAFVGTPYFVAPEVIKGSYNEKCDVWSLGVILYTMLSGSPPFPGSKTETIYKKIQNNQVSFKKKVWKSISQSAKELISKMLIKDPSLRPSITEIFIDTWIQSRNKHFTPNVPLTKQAFSNLQNFNVNST